MQISKNRTADVDIIEKRGDTLYKNWQIRYNEIPVDLSIYDTALMQIRETELSDPVLTYSSSGSTIDISNLVAGQIIINGSTDINAGHYYYDLQLNNDNTTTTIVTGRFILENDYTR